MTAPITNAVIPLSKTNLSNCSWLVDFQNLFKGEELKHRHCRVRFNLSTNTFAASNPPNVDWLNYSGYVSVNLGSMYNGETTSGAILGIIFPSDSPVTGTSIHCVQASTMSEIGVDINVPTGVQTMNITMINDDQMSLMTTFQEYQIHLTFELYDAIPLAVG